MTSTVFVAVVKPAVEYGPDLGAVWGAARLAIGVGVALIVLTAGWMLGRKILS